jgi:hypothetical protein
MTVAEIMEYAEFKIRQDLTLSLEDEIRLRRLWLGACAVDSLERIAKQLEDGQFSILEGENISSNIKLIADRLPD